MDHGAYGYNNERIKTTLCNAYKQTVQRQKTSHAREQQPRIGFS